MSSSLTFAQFPELVTKHVTLRAYTQDYAQDVLVLLSDRRVTQYETREPFSSVEQAKRYVGAREFITGKKSEGIIWAICANDSGSLIGDIGYAPHHGHNAEIGFKLRPDYWNRGIMSACLQVVVRFLFSQTETRRIEATTRPENLGAVRVLEKQNFVREGILRQCEHHQGNSFDLAMFSLLASEYQES